MTRKKFTNWISRLKRSTRNDIYKKRRTRSNRKPKEEMYLNHKEEKHVDTC